MGRALPAGLALAGLPDEEVFQRFRRGLRSSDQQALDDLFAQAQPYLAAAAETAQALTFEAFLLALLIEEHKQIIHLRALLDRERHA